MRSIHLMAATTVILIAAWGCGDGGTDVGNPPVANFTPPSCIAGTPCQFTDASTPAGEITAWSWNFGDNTALDNNQSPTHIFATPGNYTVALTVTSNNGSNSTSHTVTVTGGTGNVPPIASFDITTCTAGVPCPFHSTSSDADGQIVTTTWAFGDGNTASGVDATNQYAAAGDYSVMLTVTDNLGATGTTTQTITVSPAVSQQCTTAGTLVNCTLNFTQRATAVITLSASSCELGGNRVAITDPITLRQTIFFNGCSQPVGSQYPIKSSTGAPAVIEAGTQVVVQFKQGTADPGDPIPGAPSARFEGGYPTWMIDIEDGGNPTTPDFDDIVLTVQATAAP
jgi:PKD repeat protein